ncbi:MAG: rhomboid family intramembrane serine protease [Bacteroidota bacterium]
MYLSYAIIAITIILSLFALNDRLFFEKAKFNPWSIAHRNEWWRWVSGGFIHADYMHLGVNMLTLYFFGPILESNFVGLFDVTGYFLFAVLYLLAVPFSSMYSYYKHKDDFTYSAIGASGAVSAILFGTILFAPTSSVCLYFAICIPAWLFGILYLVYEYYMGKRQLDNIGHDAHFYGALFGLVFVIIVYPSVIPEFIGQFIGS